MRKAKPQTPPGSEGEASRQAETWPLDRVKLNPRNARKHPDKQIAQIRASLREFGWTMPILVTEDGTLIAGEGRVLAARAEGLTEVPVIVARGWSDERVRAYSIVDNRLAETSQWNDAVLGAELAALKAGDFDLGLMGFDDLLQSGKTMQPIKVQEVDTTPVADRFWISVRGPLAQQAAALQQLKAFMDELPGVQVELGTTAVDL